jgi:tetratricopeptide (TPR) repeat protein
VLSCLVITPVVAEDTKINQVDKGAKESEVDNATDKQLSRKKYFGDAVKHYNKAVELHQQMYLNQALAEYKLAVDSDSRMCEAWSNMGGIYASQRVPNKAIESFKNAVATSFPNSQQRFLALRLLAAQYVGQGDYAAAEPLYKEAVSVPEPKGLVAGQYADTLELYASLLRKMQRGDEANGLENRARSIRRASESTN